MKQRRALSLLLAALLALSLVPASAFAAGEFSDVAASAWYYGDVMKAKELGLINGYNDGSFKPGNNIRFSEVVKLAACMNEKYEAGTITLPDSEGSPWYQVYVDYAMAKGIISKEYPWSDQASRADVAEIFVNGLPSSALKDKNSVADGYIPDVDISHPQAAQIYKLYRAGILDGKGADHSFKPDDMIKRSEISAMLTRMMDDAARVEVTLGPVPTGRSFSVSFDANTGEEPVIKIVDENETAEEPLDPYIAGYKFLGWYSDPALTELYDFGAPVTKDLILYAKYEELPAAPSGKTYTVKFQSYGFGDIEDQKVLENAKAVRPEDPEREGYYLAGWFTDASFMEEYDFSAPVTSSLVLFAQWKRFTGELIIVKQPADAWQIKGEEKELSFAVDVRGGKTPYSYQWYRSAGIAGEAPIEGADGMTLRLETKSDTSVWCVITDAEGTELTTRRASAAYRIHITKQPKGGSISNPSPTFTMSTACAGGESPYRYGWYRNGSLIAGANEASYTAAEGGSYYCIATAANGQTAKTDTVVINDGREILKITEQPEEGTLPSDDSGYKAVVGISGGTAPYKYSWYLNEELEGTTDTNYKYLKKAGEWRLVITDFYGQSVKSARFWVRPKIYFTEELPEYYDYHGLRVSVSGGNLQYLYYWYKDGSPIKGAQGMNYTPDSVGSYFCRVYDTNANGAYADSNVCIVDSMLKITKQPVGGYDPDPGKTITLEVEASGGKGELTYKWMKIGSNRDTEVYTGRVFEAPPGRYYCKVSDERGYVQSSSVSTGVTEFVSGDIVKVSEDQYDYVYRFRYGHGPYKVYSVIGYWYGPYYTGRAYIPGDYVKESEYTYDITTDSDGFVVVTVKGLKRSTLSGYAIYLDDSTGYREGGVVVNDWGTDVLYWEP